MGENEQRTVGFAITGSFCTYEKVKGVVRRLVEENNRVIPIFSNRLRQSTAYLEMPGILL